MNPLPLLLDPRGRIGRGAFGLGLGLLAVPSAVALFSGAASWSLTARAAIPLMIEVGAAAAFVSGPPSDLGQAADVAGMILVLVARLYIVACLCLKRLRDQGRGPDILIAVAALTIVAHVGAGMWAYGEGHAGATVIFPGLPYVFDVMFVGTLWVGFLAWMSKAPTFVRIKPTA